MIILLPLAALLAIGAGCIERTMRINSEPPGATVYVDGEESGKTPLDLPFTHYGTREVLLQIDGYASDRDNVELRAPVYAWFPIDFVTDVLCPITIHDVKTFSYSLDPITKPNMTEFRDRGEAFADTARAALKAEDEKRGTESFSKGGYKMTPKK